MLYNKRYTQIIKECQEAKELPGMMNKICPACNVVFTTITTGDVDREKRCFKCGNILAVYPDNLLAERN